MTMSPTTTTDSFRDWLIREIRDVLERRSTPPPLLVWCDPERAWLDLLRDASAVDGFELWAPASGGEEVHELLVRDRFHAEPRAPRVVWLPCAREEISWFKVFELEAEEVWETPLLQALRQYGVEISREHEADLVGLLPAHAREWFDKPKATWKELTPGNAKGTLVDDHRMLLVLAGPEGEFSKLESEGRFDIFARRTVEDFGLPNPAGMTEDAWRVAATARLLCSEAAEGRPEEPPHDLEKIIPAGLPRTRALTMLGQWQHDNRYTGRFEKLVPRAEAATGLAHWAAGLSTIKIRSRGSRAVERALFQTTADRLRRLDDVDLLAAELEQNAQAYKDRAAGFWDQDASEPVGWRHLAGLAEAASLLIQGREAEQAWRKPDDAIAWHAESGWQLDQAGETLFKESADFPRELKPTRDGLRRGYLRTMDRVGRAFSELLSKSPEALDSLPTAGELALEELESQPQPTALLFLDACRLDIGQRLARLLNQGEPVERARARTAIAPIPSITALGMPFALPMKRTALSVELAPDNKTFVVKADGFAGDLKWAEQRRGWLKQHFDVRDWLEISEVLDGGELKKPGRARKLIAVHGDELDSHDGQLKLTGADDHLQRYARAVRKLRDAGYTRVIVVTDHGFFHWQPQDHEIEQEPPKGEILWKHRRAIVGRNLSHPSAVALSVSRSTLEAVVPRGASAFRTYGTLGFFHGGATLQELVIPVIVATWPAKARKVDIVLKPVGHVATEAPRIQLQAASTGKLLNADVNLLARRALVKIKDPKTGKVVFRHDEAVTIEPEGKTITPQLKVVDPKPELPYNAPLIVEVRDADDEELLAREDVELKIEISDW